MFYNKSYYFSIVLIVSSDRYIFWVLRHQKRTRICPYDPFIYIIKIGIKTKRLYMTFPRELSFYQKYFQENAFNSYMQRIFIKYIYEALNKQENVFQNQREEVVCSLGVVEERWEGSTRLALPHTHTLLSLALRTSSSKKNVDSCEGCLPFSRASVWYAICVFSSSSIAVTLCLAAFSWTFPNMAIVSLAMARLICC